jgi:hypothetical protein
MELDAENNQLEYLMTIWRLNDLNETKINIFCLLNSQDSG